MLQTFHELELELELDHFQILASRKTDYHSKIEETLLFINKLDATPNPNLISDKLSLDYTSLLFFGYSQLSHYFCCILKVFPKRKDTWVQDIP